MESLWKDLLSADCLAVTKAASALNRNSVRTIGLEQARAVVTALHATNTEAHRIQAWPELLKLLTSWAAKLSADGRPAGVQTRRPARPWERQQQQQTTTASQTAQQQAVLTLQLLQDAISAVAVALLEAAAALSTAARNEIVSNHAAVADGELLALLGPATAFLGAAVTAASATSPGNALVQQLQEATLAGACSAITAAAPALLTAADSASLPSVLWGYQQLLLSCKDNPQYLCWSVSCLLSALQDAFAASPAQLIAAASAASSNPATATSATLQNWAAQQLQEYAVTRVVGELAGLYLLGHALGLGLTRSAATAAVRADLNQQASSSSIQGSSMQALARLTELLHVVGQETESPASVAVAGALAAGVLAGSLEAVPTAPRDAATAAAGVHGGGSLGDVWAFTAAPGSSIELQQQQQPAWYVPLQQQRLLLLQAVNSGCQRCMQARPLTQTPAAAAAAAADGNTMLGCQLLLGHAYSKLMSAHSQAIQQLQPQQQQHTEGLHCSLPYMIRQCCSLSGVLHSAGCCLDAAAANAWLSTQQQQHPPHEVGLLARWLADAISSLATDQQLLLLHAVRAEAERVADTYDCYVRVTNPAVLQQVNAVAVRQQLDWVFATVVAIFDAAWRQLLPDEGSSNDSSNATATAVVAQGLAALAALQFCQVQLPAYVDLLRGLAAALASSSTTAGAFLSAALPCYGALVLPDGSRSSSSSEVVHCASAGTVECECHSNSNPREQGTSSSSSTASTTTDQPWLTSSVLTAKLNFLLPLIPVAFKAASDPAAAATRVLPLVLLLLPHPVRQLSDGAHSAFAGLVTAAGESAVAAAAVGMGLSAAEQSKQQQQLHVMELVQQAVPYYLTRSFEGIPACGSLEGLAVGFTCLLKQLPAGSVMSLLAVQKVTDRAAALAVQAALEASQVAIQDSQQPDAASKVASSPDSTAEPTLASNTAAAAAARLFELVQLSLQLIDCQFLSGVLHHISTTVLAVPAAVQRQWLSGLYASCLAIDDYVRKPALMNWINGLNTDVLQAWQEQGAPRGYGSAIERGSGDQDAGKPAQPPFLVA